MEGLYAMRAFTVAHYIGTVWIEIFVELDESSIKYGDERDLHEGITSDSQAIEHWLLLHFLCFQALFAKIHFPSN